MINPPNPDGSFGGWAEGDKRYLVHGPFFTGGFTQADIDSARADAKNGTIPLFGVTPEVFHGMRIKGDLAEQNLLALKAVATKLDKLSIGGDPKAFAEAVAPLLPKAPTASENAQAVIIEMKKPGN